MFPIIIRNELSDCLTLNAYKAKSLDESWLWQKKMVNGFSNIHQPTSACERCIQREICFYFVEGESSIGDCTHILV